jgi:general secretion pathway protein D
MKQSAYARFSITLFLIITLLSPTLILATEKEGKKRFNAGMKAEVAEKWDIAAEEFALAVVADPKNPEYRLHYQRALFNASQMYVKKGAAQMNEKDFAGAYLSFRKAYAYDPTNELAKGEMERALRLQRGIEGEETEEKKTDANGTVRLVPTSYQQSRQPQTTVVPQRIEKLRDVPFPNGVNLQYIIKELAKDLDLNVLFDEQTFRQSGGQPRTIMIELKNVSAAKALDYIFLQTGLFFQKVGPRTIVVADQNQRQRFQQLVLRTFYLANADPVEVAKTVQFAIPGQPGRTPTQPLVDKPTNSITVRDTTENIRIIGNLIRSLDKDRAEVVMDVQIYEVNKTDLLQFGNQIGDAGSLANLGGTTVGTFGNNEYGNTVTRTNSTTGEIIKSIVPSVLGVGVVIPAINIVALQDKQNTKLIASTQIHAFNNEDSSARIGQRVPVRSATFSTGNNGSGNGNGNGVVGDVITYEQVGLTLKFKPIVFPNQDVQVAMEIESKDVSGARTLTPLFTERTIKGTARIQNNKTLLLASVAQNSQSNGRTGLPLLGLIPILGRLFTAPTKDNRQVDIVIAVTPRVIRAPTILPEDEEERPTGSLATPTSGSLEAMITQEELEEQLAMARRLPTTAQVQLPDQKSDVPTYTKTTNTTTAQNAETATETNSAASNEATAENKIVETNPGSFINNLKPIDTSVKTLSIAPTADSSGETVALNQTSLKEPEAKNAAPTASLSILPTLSEMKTGEKVKLAVMVKSATAFRSAVVGLKFDAAKVAVRTVSYGDVFGAGMAQTAATPFINQNGRMYVNLSSPKDVAENSSGILTYIEIEALADGKPEISFVADMLNMLSADGKNFTVNF